MPKIRRRGLSGPLLFFLILSLGVPAAFAAEPLSSAATVQSLAGRHHLAEDKAWLRLLHFRDTWLGFRSDVDGGLFFLSPEGRYKPEQELRALITAFFDPGQRTGPEDQSVFCKYPARLRWLKQSLAGENIDWPSRDCPLLDRYRTAVRGPSVSLVFSSYYLNNPSSAFGHTFLRVNKEPSGRDGRRYELLDYGFNYAANADTSNAFLYGVKGLFGGFKGSFTSVPYYYKVREYNNHESRDLWQYELNIAPEKVDQLVDHLWEMGPSSISYWYLTENCSFHMLTVLEAADPDLDLISHLKKDVIPSDTLRVVAAIPGLVRHVTYRPSLRTQMFARFRQLDAQETDAALAIVGESSLVPLQRVTEPARQANVLDAALDLIDYRNSYEIQIADKPITKFKNTVLATRGANPTISPPLAIPTPQDPPEDGHPSRRAGIGWRKWEHGEESLVLRHKFALHDLDDPAAGYPNSAQITMLESDFVYVPALRLLTVDRLTLFEVISRSPWRKLTPDWSWQIRLGADRRPFEQKEQTTVGLIELGGGVTAATPLDSVSLFAGTKTGLHADFDGHTDVPRLSVGPAAGLRVRLASSLTAGAEGWWRRERQDRDVDLRELTATLHWQFAKSWGLRFEGREYTGQRSGEAQMLGYY